MIKLTPSAIKETAPNYAGVYWGYSQSGINPLVESWGVDAGVTDQNELNELSSLYDIFNNKTSEHGGRMLYFNGMSPTSPAACRKSLVHSSGTFDAVEHGTPLYSSDGVKFNTSSYWDIGSPLDGTPRNQIFIIHARPNAITLNGANGSQSEPVWAVRNVINYNGVSNSSTNLYNAGIFTFYNNGSGYNAWIDGVKTAPNTPNPIDTGMSNEILFLNAQRSSTGVALNLADESYSTLIILDDGGNLFSDSDIVEMNDAVFNYNNNL